MTPNKFKSTWISHSSLSDFEKCPRAYYLRNMYKNEDNRKISIVSPYLSLGISVHDTLEPLAWIPIKERLDRDLVSEFKQIYSKYEGKIGGFKTQDEFKSFEEKGVDMLTTVQNNPGPIAKPAVRLIQDKTELPWMFLSEEEEICVSGKVDWLEYNNGELTVIDVKTGKTIEKDESMQFPIYTLLVKHYKKYPLTKAAYWYIAKGPNLTEKKLLPYDEARNLVLSKARILKEARLSNNLKCPYSGCRNCEPLERILKGEGEFLGVGGYGSAQYYL